MNANDHLTIGDLARRTGLSTSAIRFYEDKGLIESFRTAGNQRRFLRSLPKARAPSSFDWWKISEAIRESLDRRIEQLRALRDNLDGCIGCGCLSLKTCQLYNPEDRARAAGPGPRFVMTAESVRPPES